MDTPFTKYTSRDTETLDHYESHDEFESNGPFNSEQHDQAFSGTYESYDRETEMDQFGDEETEEFGEENFSDEQNTTERINPLTEQEIAQEIEYQVNVVNGSKAKKPEGRTNWAKGALSRVLGSNLPDDNTLDAATKKMLGDFQTKNNLQPTQQLNAATERALLEADALLRSKGTVSEAAATSVINTAKIKIEDWTKKAVNNKPNHILNDYRDPRKIFAFVLHHMAFKRWNPKTKAYSNPESYLSTGAHFCIMLDGRIIQLHAFSRMIWHGNCASGGSVAVEFEGNFPDVKGKWWINKESKVQNKDNPTQAQYDSGRFLTSYLKTVLNITRIMAHRQSSKDRENDPGPDIWYNVGQWAIDKLGLSDGGPTAKCGDGNPILPAWRTWENKTGTAPTKEFHDEFEDHECAECKKKSHEYEMDDRETHDNETEYALEIESETEQETETSYESESGFNSFYETDEVSRDWSEAVKSNRKYGQQISWYQHIDKINDMLLPYSGMSNVSLGEEAFAEAVFKWQGKNGFTGNNVDGVIGPATWAAMSKALNIKYSPSPKTSSKGDIGPGGGTYKKRNQGWVVFGGGSLREKLYELRGKQKLTITPNEIEMFRLVSIPESDGLVNVINSWDDMYMSMGFIQLTIRYYELAQVIKKAPEAFRKYGIELDPNRKYFPKEKNSVAIKNAPNIGDLRSREWAERFYQAGLEDDVIVAQIQVGRQILNTIRIETDKTNFLDRFNNQYPVLWAFIYEAHNSRPAPFKKALIKTIAIATPLGISNPTPFGKILIEQLRIETTAHYTRENKLGRIPSEQAKIDSIIKKVGHP